MIFTPDPIKRAKRMLRENTHRLIDAEVNAIVAAQNLEVLKELGEILRNTVDQLEKQNAQNPAD